MDIRTQRNDNKLTLAPSGMLDSSNSAAVSEILMKEFTAEITTLEFDMSDVEYISSKGLRIITAAYKDIKDRGSIIVTGCNPAVKEVFSISGLDKRFTVE